MSNYVKQKIILSFFFNIYLQNGAEIIETLSYQINVSNLTKGLNIDENHAKEIIKTTVAIAKDAVGNSGLGT